MESLKGKFIYLLQKQHPVFNQVPSCWVKSVSGWEGKQKGSRSRKDFPSSRAESREGLWSRVEVGGRDARTNREWKANSWHSKVWEGKSRWEDMQSLRRRVRSGGCCWREVGDREERLWHTTWGDSRKTGCMVKGPALRQEKKKFTGVFLIGLIVKIFWKKQG